VAVNAGSDREGPFWQTIDRRIEKALGEELTRRLQGLIAGDRLVSSKLLGQVPTDLPPPIPERLTDLDVAGSATTGQAPLWDPTGPLAPLGWTAPFPDLQAPREQPG
jgi:hypothetical protein